MMMELNNISKTYCRGGRSFYALKNINLTLTQGDFVQIIGRSGSGKSTLLNIMAGLLWPSEGEVKFNGKALHHFSKKELCKWRNETVGFISQGTSHFPHLTVIENVLLPACLYFDKNKDLQGRALHLLHLFGLSDMANSYPNELSGGENKRMLIARAFMNNPKLIIADEPCSDLDIENTKLVMAQLKQLNEQEGTSIVLVSHDLSTLHYGKSIYTMIDGTLNEGNSFQQVIE